MDKWSKMGRDGVLIITGEGELRNELERKIHEMGLVEKVRLVGYQSETDLVRMFTGSIAFLSPSKMEGLDWQWLKLWLVELLQLYLIRVLFQKW